MTVLCMERWAIQEHNPHKTQPSRHQKKALPDQGMAVL